MAKNKFNTSWLHDHINDPYVKLAQREGYRARAAYKLKEIDEQDKLIRPGQVIVDLGSAPGSWSQYVRNKLSAGYYYSVWPEWVLSVTGEVGDIFGWGAQPVLLQDRFFVGGDNLRGFEPAGIGPRDTNSGDALGDNNYYVGSVALGIPLGLPKEPKVARA